MSGAADSNTVPVPEAVAVWADYAKDRYDAGEKRLADFRGWARQLAAAVGVVVGLEGALIGQVLRLEADARLLGICLVLLLATAAWQLVIMARAVAAGYAGKELLVPESPVVLADHLGGKDEAEARRMVGAYYAKGSDNVHAAAEGIARETSGVARAFKRSLWLLFMAMALAAGITAASSHLRKAMADTPSSAPGPSEAAPASPAPPVPATPSPSPAATPLLVTPTPGATETHGAPAPQHQGLLSTPTEGLRLTEGIEYRKK